MLTWRKSKAKGTRKARSKSLATSSTYILSLILPIVISGYALYGTRVVSRLWAEPTENQRYFRMLLCGYLWILLISPMFMPYLNDFIADLKNNFSDVNNLERMDMENLVKTVLAIGLRMLLDVIYKLLRVAKCIDKDYHQGWLRNKLLERNLYNYSKSLELVIVNLKNDKVYIGFIFHFDLPEVNWIGIVPLRSGYRDKKKRLQLTTDYYQGIKNMIKNLDKKSDESIVDVYMLIPSKEIVALQNYNPYLYNAMNTPTP